MGFLFPNDKSYIKCLENANLCTTYSLWVIYVCVWKRRTTSCPCNHYFSDGSVLSGASGLKYSMSFNHLKVPGGKDRS